MFCILDRVWMVNEVWICIWMHAECESQAEHHWISGCTTITVMNREWNVGSMMVCAWIRCDHNVVWFLWRMCMNHVNHRCRTTMKNWWCNQSAMHILKHPRKCVKAVVCAWTTVMNCECNVDPCRWCAWMWLSLPSLHSEPPPILCCMGLHWDAMHTTVQMAWALGCLEPALWVHFNSSIAIVIVVVQ